MILSLIQHCIALLRPTLALGRARFAVLFPVVALLMLAAPPPRAAACILFRHSTGGAEYINLGGRTFLGGRFPIYADTSCQTRHPTHDSGWYLGGVAYASSASAARSICAANHRAFISSVSPVGNNFWRCATGGGGGSSGSGGTGAFQREQLGFRDIPNLPLTGLKVRAFDGADSGIQFRRLTQFFIGIQSVLDLGVLDAVDVWSHIGSGYEVCFPARGRIVFLDASTSPRSVIHLDAYSADSYTCATSDRAGTLVLVELEEGASAQPAAASQPVTRRPGTNDDVETAIALEDCLVTPRYNLRLRAAPWGRILAVIPTGTVVVAQARTQSWFNVTHVEQEGWSAAWLVDSEGDCEWPTEAEGTEAVSA